MLRDYVGFKLNNLKKRKKNMINDNFKERNQVKKLLNCAKFGAKKNRQNKLGKMLLGRLILRQIRPVFFKRFENLLLLGHLNENGDGKKKILGSSFLVVMRAVRRVIKLVRRKFYRLSLIKKADFNNVTIYRELRKLNGLLRYRFGVARERDYILYKKKYRTFLRKMYRLGGVKLKNKTKVSLLLMFLSRILNVLNVSKYLVNNIKIKRFSRSVRKLFKEQAFRLIERRSKQIIFDIGIGPDWIGSLHRKRSHSQGPERKKKVNWYLKMIQNVKNFYNYKKDNSAWLFARKLRQLKKKLTLEKYMKYFEVNLKTLVYRSGLVPSYELAEKLVRCARICVNGKAIDNALHPVENFDVISFDSTERGRLKIRLMQYMETIFYSRTVSTVGLKLKFLEYNYLVFGFVYLSMFYSVKKTPMLTFKFFRKFRERLIGWGKYQTAFKKKKGMV